MTIWGKKYKDLIIKSDFRVHNKVAELLETLLPSNPVLLDIATGNGALAKRVSDLFPNAKIDINDFESEANFEDFQNSYHFDLNETFKDKFSQYDCILAIEIIEHLQNPWHFISNLKPLLKEDGYLIISTPNTDSFLDRLHYIIEGNSFYFGENGFDNSGGHITEVPSWLMKKIATQNKLSLVELFSVDTKPHFGKKKRLLALMFYPIYLFFAKRKNDRSINIFLFKNES